MRPKSPATAHPRARAGRLLWLALAIAAVAPAHGADGGQLDSRISQMMWTMADIMGLGRGNRLQTGLQSPAMAGMPITPGMIPHWGNLPAWQQFMRVPSQAGEAFANRARQAAGAYSAAGGFDGIWQGGSGETLGIRGDRFYLHADAQRTSAGLVRVQGDWLVFYIPDTGVTLAYEYIRNSRVMVLRGTDGQTLIFHRAQSSDSGGLPATSVGGPTQYGAGRW